MALKWCLLGILSSASRTDPNVLSKVAPYIQPLVTQYVDISGYDTPGDLLAALAADSMVTWGSRLPYIPERISYPAIYGGPVNFYLPDLQPSYAEYPYTVQAYSCSFTAYRGLDAPLNYTTLIIASALDTAIPPPVGTPDPVTIQLKRDKAISLYSVKPSDASVLPKYGAPVKFIRAKFNTTRVAVITETISGGFMIYEEASLGVATGPVYIYSSKRKLLHIVDVGVIDQYRLYTF